MAAGRVFPRAGALPVLLDGDHVDKAERGALQHAPHAAPRAQSDAEALCRSVDRDELSAVDLEHDAGRGGLDRDLAGVRHDARLSARPHAGRRLRPHRDDGGGDLPGAAAAPLSAARRCDQPPPSRQHSDLGDPDLSDDAGAVLRLAAARLFQDRAKGSRGSRAHRRREPAADDAADLSAVVHAGVHLGRDLCLHPVAERVSLCADLPDPELGADGPGRGHRRADSRRCVLLGQIDGGSALGLDPGRADLLLLRRALRRRADLRLGEGLAASGAQPAATICPVTSRWSSLRHRAAAIAAGQPAGGSTRAAPAEPPSPSGGAPRATSPAEEAIAMSPLRQRWTTAPSGAARTAPSRSPAAPLFARSNAPALRFASSVSPRAIWTAPAPDQMRNIAAVGPNACDTNHIACDAVHIRVKYFLGSTRLFDFAENSAPAALEDSRRDP